MENELVQAIILGILQGITEVLPISSSAHLVLAPWAFGWEDPGLAFDVALHVGTLLAVLAYFWKDWVDIILVFCGKTSKYRAVGEAFPKNLLWLIVVATVPGILAGYFLNQQAETVFRQPILVATMLVLFGALLLWADRNAVQKRKINQLKMKDSIIIGLSQAAAIIPGVSRSGITITAGLHQGLERREAARFSFLLSTPIILGAAIYQAREFYFSGIDLAGILGIMAAAASGYLAIYWLIRFVGSSNYRVFFWYRLALASVIIVLALLVK